MQDRQNKVLFYGPLGKKKKFIVGGGETGNYRTIYLLKKNNYEVSILQKPYPEKNVFGYGVYIIKMMLIIIAMTFRLLTKKINIVHISGFYLHLIYHEFFLVTISKMFKKKCIYELRGGGVVESYNNRSFIYRLFFRATLNNASVILCQGKSYIDFLKKITTVPVFHYPNFILNEFLTTPSGLNGTSSKIELVYFGRLAKSKNIDLIIQTCSELQKQNVNFNLELIGKGDRKYIEHIKELCEYNNLSDKINITPPVKHQLLKQKLNKKHFFLFPSNEKREGHSNALTEAMSLGVVPVCSNAGFNAEIVGDNNLIVSEFTPLSYASVVNNIWKAGQWKQYSSSVANRIKKNYTEQIVEDILVKAYNYN
ncbi:MAG TPA: glycosyltransferase family 4 protein [Mariniphaga sp.]|nr:glycosyltransferase family 4 protein [Mariniphaga sp.]